MEITAVGGATVDKVDKKDDAAAVGSGGIRPTRLTPGSGGLPEMLARAGRGAGTPADSDVQKPIPRPTRAKPPVAGFDSEAITAVGGAVVERQSASGDQKTDAGGTDSGRTVGAAGIGTGGAAPDPSVPRPTRLTPGSGGLAALLAQTRSRTGKHEILERQTAVAASDPGGSDADPVTPRPLEPAAAGLAASLPEKKNSNFAATLMGVPAPEIHLPRPAVAARQPASYLGTSFAPQAVDEGDLTERNPEISGDADDSAGIRARVRSEERVRATEVVEVVKASRGPRFAVGAIGAAAVILIAVVLIVPRLRKSPGQASRALPGASPTESSPPTAAPTAPIAPSTAVPAADPATTDPNAVTATPAVPPATAGEGTTAKDDTDDAKQARADAEGAKAAKDDAKEKARTDAEAAKAARAEARQKARSEAKAAKLAKAEARKQARAEAKATKTAKDEAKKLARAEANAAKAIKDEAGEKSRAENKAARAAQDQVKKTARAEVNAAKAEARKQARAEASAAKVAKAEARKQARAEASAAKVAKVVKEEAETGTRPGLPWENSSTESNASGAARPDLRRPASVSEAAKPKSSVPAKPVEDPDGTLPLSTR